MKNILLVDDNPLMLKFISNVLDKKNYKVVTAKDGLSALDILKTYTPDVIIVDLIMPNIDGKKLCKVIRNMPKLKDVYIIILSAVAAEEEIDITKLGANAYVAKGPMNEMAEKIFSVLDQPDLAYDQCLSGEIIGIKSVYPRVITEELLSAKRHFEVILEKMSEGIIEINPERRILFANLSALSIIDMPEEKLLGSYFLDLFSEDERKRIASLMETADDKLKKITEDSPVCLNGYLVTLDVLPLQTKEHSSIIILNDITERKEAEKNLREINEFLKSILDSSFSISIISTDIEGNVLFWNKGAENIFGYRSEEIVGQKIKLLYPEDEEERVEKEIRPLVTNEKREISCDVRQVTKDDKELWMKLNLSPRFDYNGNVIGILGIGEDISERKRTEEALQSEKEKFQALVEESPLGVALIGRDNKYKYINPKFVEIFGYTLEDVSTGLEWFEKAYPDKEYRDLVISTWLRDIEESKNNESRHRTFDVTCKDGSEKVINFIPMTLKTGDQLIIYKDITNEKKLESELIQAQKMEAIGKLSGGIAHDFGNFLTTIYAYCDILSTKLKKDDPLREYVKEIMKVGERAESLTIQLLSFSRKQVGRPAVIDLNIVLADIEKMLRRLIREDIEFVTILNPEIGRVKVDPGQITQVIMNLVINARDAMPNGGKLTIETANIYLDEDYGVRHGIELTSRAYVVLAVSDTGIGMDKETQMRIFEPFFTRKGAGDGTGLGLATVYGIVKQSGGYIWVYSEPRLGTTFKIYLPIVDEVGESLKKKPAAKDLPQGSETILVVEDDDKLREMARGILEKYGYIVLMAQDGEAAQRVSAQYKGPIHIMVSDVVMPRMSGPELAEHLEAWRPEMKVLFMSGYTENAVIHNKVVDQDTNFIEKPYTPDQLVLKVREVLDQSNGKC